MEHSETFSGGIERPPPTRPFVERMRAWLDWFGLARLVVSAVSVVVICAGAFWLVRSPPPSAEAVLPRTSGVTLPGSTLPTPVAPVVADAGAVDGVLVHVAGAVVAPDVYRFSTGDRVDDAIAAAGGVVADADLTGVNLAAILVDGTRIYVPLVGERPPALEPPIATEAAVGPVDVNRADAELLDTLPGVGPATATAIVTERERNGPFLGVDDLERVPGIGPAKLDALREFVTA